MEAIDTMKPENLFIFHVNDSEDLPKEQLNDSHRLYPGLGILPLTEMKKRLDNIGYTEMASIEIFRPEYWNQDPYEVAKLSRENTIKAFGLTEKAASA
jgi:2-keto-myo-inositol isomerase